MSSRSTLTLELMELSKRVRVVLVQPMYSGNVGSVARAMKNFGFSDLVLVSPLAEIDDVARRYAVKAQEILDRARVVTSVKEAVGKLELVVGATARMAKSASNLLRSCYSPREVASIVSRTSARTAFLFGREDIGLKNEELELCDIILGIPASHLYPTLNVASAAAIVMYELFTTSTPRSRLRAATAPQIIRILEEAGRLLEEVDCPLFRRKKSVRALRNVFGRASLTPREASLLLGLFRKARVRLENYSPVPSHEAQQHPCP